MKSNDLFYFFIKFLDAPQVGFEPTTYRLTADRSTAELLRIRNIIKYKMQALCYFPKELLLKYFRRYKI